MKNGHAWSFDRCRDFGGRPADAIGAGVHRDAGGENLGSLERIRRKARGDYDTARADIEG
jgi:hypothetical protein